MQKAISFIIIGLLVHSKTFAQTVRELVSLVRESQKSIRTISYKMTRNDTLVTGDIRTISGDVKMQVDTSETVFGFDFWAKEDGVNSQMIFNGNMAYETDDENKVYDITTSPAKMEDLLYHAGGRIVVPDLVKLDTSGARGFRISKDERFYFLTIYYPDLTAYDVINRYKKITIDKAQMLPVAVTQHQETLGKVQNLAWNVQHMRINEAAFRYDFASPDILKTYSQKVRAVSSGHPLMTLKGKPAPQFHLKSFDGKIISSQDLDGKVVLLDFWEVWCGPCIESMPKVQQLYARFKDKGFMVYGVTNDLKQLESSKKYALRKPEIQFPMLIGNAGVKDDYRIDAVPQYVLIDRHGKITFLSLGYSGDIESAIVSALNGK